MKYVFTACALNFFPAAKLLFESVAKHIPDARKIICIVDELPADFDIHAEGIDELIPFDLLRTEIDGFRGWTFSHDVMELCTAVKPFIFERLLARPDCESVLFFDCDCILFQPPDVVYDTLKTASVALTPHAAEASGSEDWVQFELNTLRVGVYNLGFIGLRNDATANRLVRWWKARLRRYCYDDPGRFLFTDQKWMDLATCYFDDVKVIRSPTLNIARWNTFQRPVTRGRDGTVLVDGLPACFVHFSGFSKKNEFVLGLYNKVTSEFIRDKKVLEELSRWYAQKLAPSFERELFTRPWAFGVYDDGQAISGEERRFYRSQERLTERYPDPFSTRGTDTFRRHFHDVRAETGGIGPRSGRDWRQRAEAAEKRLERIERSTRWRLLNAVFGRLR